MHTTNPIHFDDLELFLPDPKNDLAITIPNRDTINFNQKLLPQLPEYIEIRVGERGSVLGVKENTEGYRISKSGSIKKQGKRVIERLLEHGVRLPARYSVTREGDYWLARLEEQEIPTLNTKKARRPREKNVTGLYREVAEA